MPRSPRSPQGKAVRLTIYVEPDTKRRIIEYAAATHQSPGEIVDQVFDAVEAGTVAPRASDARASLPSLAGQPGVEHRATAVIPTAAVARNEGVTIIACQPNDCIVTPFYDHPGWKLSATGQNICVRCGKTKLRSKNASCKAPT